MASLYPARTGLIRNAARASLHSGVTRVQRGTQLNGTRPAGTELPAESTILSVALCLVLVSLSAGCAIGISLCRVLGAK